MILKQDDISGDFPLILLLRNIKSMKNILIFILLITILIFSCSEKIELKIPHAEPQIVVYGVLQPDSLIEVTLLKTLPLPGDSSFENVNNARVELYTNGEYTEDLQYISDGLYRASHTAQSNLNYEIYVELPGFERIHAETTVPEPVYIAEGTIIPDVYYNHQQSHYDSEAEISFIDPAGSEDFYQVSLYSYSLYVNPEQDSIYHFSSICYLHSNNSVILNEGDLDFYNDIGEIKSLVFSDNLLDKQNNWIDFYVHLFFGEFNPPFCVFRHIHQDYYAFHKSWVRQSYNSGLRSFFATDLFYSINPNDLYTNIENGLGIFSSYAETHYELQIID